MQSFTLKSPVDSLELSCILVEPAAGTAPKGVVQMLHGMCEHKERFIHFLEFLADKGYVCIIHDHRGHGASVRCPEDLGYMGPGGWDAMIEDTRAVNEYVRSKYPGLRVHLIGHSMGSLIARCYAKRYDSTIATLTLSGCPSDNPAKGAGKILATLFGVLKGWHYRPQLLQKMSFGTFNKPFENEGYPKAWVCSDPAVLEDYHKDPLCQYVFTADGFRNLLCLMQYCYCPAGWAVKNPSLKVHFISGAQDPCRISDKALQEAVDLMKRVGYADTDLKIYPGMRHEVLHETDKQTVWNDVLATLD